MILCAGVARLPGIVTPCSPTPTPPRPSESIDSCLVDPPGFVLVLLRVGTQQGCHLCSFLVFVALSVAFLPQVRHEAFKVELPTIPALGSAAFAPNTGVGMIRRD